MALRLSFPVAIVLLTALALVANLTILRTVSYGWSAAEQARGRLHSTARVTRGVDQPVADAASHTEGAGDRGAARLGAVPASAYDEPSDVRDGAAFVWERAGGWPTEQQRAAEAAADAMWRQWGPPVRAQRDLSAVVPHAFERSPLADRAAVPEATVVVSWRESISLTEQCLREVLEHTKQPMVHVIYIHIDLVYFEAPLRAARALQQEFPNLSVLRAFQWENKHTLMRMALDYTTTPLVAVHENNNLGLGPQWLSDLIRAMEMARPRPVIIAPNVVAINQAGSEEELDHHAVMCVAAVRDFDRVGIRQIHDYTPLLAWEGCDGLPTHKYPEIMSAHAVELHSYLVNISRIGDLDTIYGTTYAFASYHIATGMRLMEAHGWGSTAVARGAKLRYMYPNTHMNKQDTLLAAVRWNAFDCTASVVDLEKRYAMRYHHEGGWDWHNAAAFHETDFTEAELALGEGEEALHAGMAVVMLALQHVTHVTLRARIRDADGAERWQRSPPQMSLREALTWLSNMELSVAADLAGQRRRRQLLEVGVEQMERREVEATHRMEAGEDPTQRSASAAWFYSTFPQPHEVMNAVRPLRSDFRGLQQRFEAPESNAAMGRMDVLTLREMFNGFDVRKVHMERVVKSSDANWVMKVKNAFVWLEVDPVPADASSAAQRNWQKCLERAVLHMRDEETGRSHVWWVTGFEDDSWLDDKVSAFLAPLEEMGVRMRVRVGRFGRGSAGMLRVRCVMAVGMPCDEAAPVTAFDRRMRLLRWQLKTDSPRRFRDTDSSFMLWPRRRW